MIPHLAPWQWIVGALCAFQIGVAKTGVPGFATLVVPVMILTVGDARRSAGWLLPILCVADLFAIFYWRRHAAARRLFALAPWVLAGIAAGAAALALDERILRPLVGAIILAMLAAYLWRRFQPDSAIAPHNAAYGIAAGFATTVANAAGPVMNLYLLSKRLPKEEFVATGAWFFFFVNLSKLPIYIYYGLFSAASLAFDALMIPAVLAGALAGRSLLHLLPPRVFETVVIALTAASTLLLFR
ncbi:MAG: TSUP family transporter [Bryobacteraceae bacterium]